MGGVGRQRTEYELDRLDLEAAEAERQDSPRCVTLFSRAQYVEFLVLILQKVRGEGFDDRKMAGDNQLCLGVSTEGLVKAQNNCRRRTFVVHVRYGVEGVVFATFDSLEEDIACTFNGERLLQARHHIGCP